MTTTDRLLFLDDDHLVQPGTIATLSEVLDTTDTQLVSGTWDRTSVFAWSHNIGAVYLWATKGEDRVLFNIPVDEPPRHDRGYTLVEVDSGLPAVMVETEIFDTVFFDDRYDFFYEWIDFWLQSKQEELNVRACLEARFRHEEFEDTGSTIRTDHDPDADRGQFKEKWGATLDRDAELDFYSWKYAELLPMKVIKPIAPREFQERPKQGSSRLRIQFSVRWTNPIPIGRLTEA